MDKAYDQTAPVGGMKCGDREDGDDEGIQVSSGQIETAEVKKGRAAPEDGLPLRYPDIIKRGDGSLILPDSLAPVFNKLAECLNAHKKPRLSMDTIDYMKIRQYAANLNKLFYSMVHGENVTVHGFKYLSPLAGKIQKTNYMGRMNCFMRELLVQF
jgi:hypothetical protein